jgi:hypothetical protein
MESDSAHRTDVSAICDPICLVSEPMSAQDGSRTALRAPPPESLSELDRIRMVIPHTDYEYPPFPAFKATTMNPTYNTLRP